MDRRLLLVCAALICLALQGPAAKAQVMPSGLCGLEGFELDTLSQPTYWSMTIDSRQCLIPNDYTEPNVTSCVVHLSVCKPLPAVQCGGQTNSSTCQEVTTSDNKKHYFSIGDYRGNDGYAPLGGNDNVGFATIRQGDTISSLLCNNIFETTITWICDSSAKWDPSSQDATKHIRTSSNGLSDCELIMTLSYDGACYTAPTLAPDTCEVQPYDIATLAAQDFWYATVPPEVCYRTGNTACKIFFAFCQALPLTINSTCYGAAVCQVGSNTEGESYAYNMGKFNNNTRIVDNDDDVGGGFHMDAENGTQPEDGRCNRVGGLFTRVVLVCNTTAEWTSQDVTAFVRAVHIGTDPCFYQLEIPYSGACIPILPERGLRPSPVGWILIGLFFFAVIVYLVVGTGFQYVARGARGLEMIPNYEFWMQFFMMVLEGCKFSLDIITCFQCGGMIKTSTLSAGRGGVEYDKI